MKKLTCQISGGKLLPFSQEDAAELSNFKSNQLVRVQVRGATKQRSINQLRLFWACCNTVAENTEDAQWGTKEKVAFQVKVALHFVDPSMVAVRPDGTVVFQYRSISFANLGHIESCRFFDRAFEIMSKKIGVSVEALTENAEEK